VLTALSRAFDLAEGRRPGHAQRVAYAGTYLATEMGLEPARIEDVFFGCLLHDVGMAASAPGPRPDTGRRSRSRASGDRLPDETSTVEGGRWAAVIETLTIHCELGAKVGRKLGFGENVAKAIASHHDSWDSTGLPISRAGESTSVVARIVAVADGVESIIDAEASPLMVRKRGPHLIREMGGSELDPELADTMAAIAGRDEFWLGLYDNDLATTLMALNYGGVMNRDEIFDLLAVFSDVVDGRNGREIGRGRHVADLARRVALTCDMSERRADLVKVAALLQDIGTLGVPAHFLSKPDILTIDEMSVVQLHPVFARDILSEMPGLGAAAWWVGCHHERIDGRGYPGMLEADEVPTEAQIIGMCEAFDALTSDRPYRRAMSKNDAFGVMRGLCGTRFESYLLTHLESVVGPFQA
jgi:HD-GYP domain-containing protein (c-di-GMP phosphodiesterase class II)